MTSHGDPRRPLPCGRRSPTMVRWFTWYVRKYLRKNFHAVRLANDVPLAIPAGPIVVVLNHPSWWDPLLCVALAELFRGREHYAVIDSAALARYRIFERLGFFGVELGTAGGALNFLRTSRAILNEPGAMLWITAQGHFADPRDRPIRLQPGVGHLLHRLDGAAFVPLAIEYLFWGERYPEALARFGEPILIERGAEKSADDWLGQVTDALEKTMNELAQKALARDASQFHPLIAGKAGVGGFYDLWRRLRAFLHREKFQPAHGNAPAASRGDGP